MLDSGYRGLIMSSGVFIVLGSGMQGTCVVARAHPNIALVKYWGKRDAALNLPAVPSLSLTVDRFATKTELRWGMDADDVSLDGHRADPKTRARVLAFLDLAAPNRPPCAVHSHNNFPSAAGLASSSSAYAALALAIDAAAGTRRSREALSALARRGSGSACRSLWGGFVEWRLGERPDGTDSHGIPIAPASHWDIALVVAVVSEAAKATGSTDGMEHTRHTSPFYDTWIAGAHADVARAKEALLRRDLEELGEVMEASTFKMHATMHASRPPLVYWRPQTLACLETVWDLRLRGIGAWATMDAGPNVKVLCLAKDADAVARALTDHAQRTEILRPGGDPSVESR